MLVVMTRLRYWQNAGREELLAVGQAYDLPEAVGAALIATGSAVRAHVVIDREAAVTAPPETGRKRRKAVA